MRHWWITRNSNVVIQTGSTYISDSMTDITEISTANMGFSTTPSEKKLTQAIATTTDNRKQQYIAFLAVGRCRNHLANLVLSSTSSKIPNLALGFRRYLSVPTSRDAIISVFGPYWYFCLSVGRYYTHLPTSFYTYTWSYIPLSLEF